MLFANIKTVSPEANPAVSGKPEMLSPPPKSADAPWEPWDPVNFGDTKKPVVNKTAAVKAPAAGKPGTPGIDQQVAELSEAVRQKAYESGFESGRSDGLKAGQAEAEKEARQVAARLAQAISRFDSSVASLEGVVADEVLALALEIARKVIGQTVVVQPQVILGTIRGALASVSAQHAAIHLNPADAALVRSHAGEQLTRAGHRIHDDPKLGRGDVVIETGGAHLDGRLATRWQRVLATLDQDLPWLIADETEPS